MPQNSNQPRPFDVVLGSQIPTPGDAAVLGGLPGVKQRLASTAPQNRIAALKEALQHGDAGLDLVIQALQNEVTQVRWAAYSLLGQRKEPRIRQALREYNPWQKFTCLRTLEGHSYCVSCVIFSPDGQTLFTGSWDKTIKVWELATGWQICTLDTQIGAESLAISPDGQTLFSGLGNTVIKVWDWQTRREISILGEPNVSAMGVHGLAVSRDGQILFSGDWGLLKAWDWQMGKELYNLRAHSIQIYCLAISLDGQTLVCASRDKTITVWDLPTAKQIHRFKGYSKAVTSVALTGDKKTLVSGSWDGSIKVWDLQTGKEIYTLVGDKTQVNCVAISPDGQTFSGGGGENAIKVWDLQTGQQMNTLTGHKNHINSLAISPDGQTLVSCSWDKTIKVWGLA
ncbi:hypothetical protein [uncultured Nostoc sp.]|uniref:beta-propeller domain-containing protein n=1 Tax=uncultured Nostoc sp. TaxID=340711 RepID=UPI0035C98584